MPDTTCACIMWLLLVAGSNLSPSRFLFRTLSLSLISTSHAQCSMNTVAFLVMSRNIAQIMLWPHALTAGRNDSGLRFPAASVPYSTCQEQRSIQLDAREAGLTTHLQSIPENGHICRKGQLSTTFWTFNTARYGKRYLRVYGLDRFRSVFGRRTQPLHNDSADTRTRCLGSGKSFLFVTDTATGMTSENYPAQFRRRYD